MLASVSTTLVPSEQRDQEHDDLQALMTSPGWQRVLGYAHEQWGPQSQLHRMQTLLLKVPVGDKAGSEDTVAQVIACGKAIMELLEFPARRLKALRDGKRPEPAIPEARRRDGS